MTRLAMWLAVVIVLLPGPAAAQQALFVEGLTELARTMLASSGDAGRATAAIDKMAAALDGWETQASSSSGHVLLGDEAAREMALFERARREATEDRRRTMAADAQRQDEAHRDDAR